jgi:23S rRNA pseudouridine2605 synthase
MRLAKYIAHAGVASRRAAEELIDEGRVRVEGHVVRNPAEQVEPGISVTVDGRPVGEAEARVAYILHKPVGVLSTARDPFGRPTVLELLEPGSLRLYPVGRLDADSSGLILLTNDGELANRLTHPRYEVSKTYRVLVDGGPVAEDVLRELRTGVRLEDGPTAPAQVRRLQRGAGGAERLEVTIREGRNRQVRRMCEAVGHPVLALQRVSFGPLSLGELAPGESRRLGEDELKQLRRSASRPRRQGRREPV